MELVIEKINQLKGNISVPGDKSISHRSLILGSIAQGETRIYNFLNSLDCLQTLECMQSLGAEIELGEDNFIKIKGKGLYGLQEPKDMLEVGNSGTTIRLLAGLLSGQNFYSVLNGDHSIRKRPMKRVVQPLRLMGADIWGREDGQLAPLSIKGSLLNPLQYTLPVASAQVKSALLLAGLYAAGETIIKEPLLTRDHTERMLSLMEADIMISHQEIIIIGGKYLKGTDLFIPGDISSAAYFIAAASMLKSSQIVISQVGVNPTRTGIIKILKRMGAKINILNYQLKSNEPRADLEIEYSELKGIEIMPEEVPFLIDELPLIALVATQAEGKTIVSGAKELRVKETDRLKAIVSELKKMGANIKEKEDGFIVVGPSKLQGAACESYHDHRIAMSLAIAALLAEGKTVIKNSECIDISFPGFENTLQKLISF
ncbi:MAG: 3-phosphoshikimate 1-carboxyvinyltransferase [Candidatus Infernicultor aquiphilus]|uniref:3-phosphoshikimate 1-carboxyvinyltransferase n=1 Tax=Candidatus Infernicultor aquiphilus TaxID=1805029 RepID=A0A2M7PLZ8_9BACT|nr:MAG: 3-phosphoshikimate 1-carboxyvinyltransferase [Candidatus Atribacteria bacterium CG08_land_8_20_14_0_20_33_29]PIW12678.1 MAG: 3-phosphoshikimate 1-carboxyvinyltransferase [Candidatus Atribacteria bacterium CG17_big_fil_post_rev_8_21_14_2_50_34_11]PIY31650.1 MAG: 3-phosphoshikimate 1-carboxyvinyltransferase [Candidatus Atribacteria bacterium CG_4_10_14_3_um_filter_34_13]PJB58121.1 MAG: 3-phosphoshikimate 1-carboxyvinyltransferase [Candidatus Atribacteria bacterium CG_4_9_14_3_um_filter_33_